MFGVEGLTIYNKSTARTVVPMKKSPTIRVLFYVHVSSHLKAALKLIEKLKASNDYEPIVYLNFNAGWNLRKDIVFCRQNDIPYITDIDDSELADEEAFRDPGGQESAYYNPGERSANEGVVRKLKRTVIRFGALFVYMNYCRKRIRGFMKAIETNKIDVVILPEDPFDDMAFIVKAARNLRRPSLLIPFAKSNHEDVVQLFKKDVRGISTLFCLMFPKWKMNFQGVDCMPLTLPKIIAMELLRIAPVQPFNRMGGLSDVMLVENEDDLNYYRDNGIPESKMKKTGAVYQDIFAEALSGKSDTKTRIYRKYGIVDQRPVILCNLFPIATPVDEPFVGFEYSSVREAVSFWLDPLLAAGNFQVWVNHHPRTNLEFVRYLEELDLKVIYEPIEDVLPFCDLYVTGVSSTYRMAMSLAKPIICYTEFYVYTDLDNFKSVCLAKSKAAYPEVIEKVTGDTAYFETLKMHAREESKNFGPIDGKSYERILKTINTLLKEKSLSA